MDEYFQKLHQEAWTKSLADHNTLIVNLFLLFSILKCIFGCQMKVIHLEKKKDISH